MKNLTAKTEEIFESLKRIETNGTQQIDIDVCLQQIRDLYAMALKLNDIPAPPNMAAIPKNIQPKTDDFIEFGASPTTSIPEESKIALPKEDDKPYIQEIIKPEAEIVVMPEIKPMEFVQEIQKKPIEEIKPIAEPEPAKKVEVTAKANQPSLFNGLTESDNRTIGEQLGENKTSLNEILGLKQTQQDVASRLNLKPITDIKAAIGVGDRFLFIRELFDGDNDLFNKTIEHLNGLQAVSEAEQFLSSKFNWNADSNTVKHFISIVQRKYGR